MLPLCKSESRVDDTKACGSGDYNKNSAWTVKMLRISVSARGSTS